MREAQGPLWAEREKGRDLENWHPRVEGTVSPRKAVEEPRSLGKMHVGSTGPDSQGLCWALGAEEGVSGGIATK